MVFLPWEMCISTSPAAWMATCVFSQLLLVAFVRRLVVNKHQDGKPKKCQRRGNEGNARGSLILQPSQQPLETHCSPAGLEVDGVCEPDHRFSCTIKDLIRYLDMVTWEKLESGDSSETSSMAEELSSSSSMSLTCSSDDFPDSIIMGDDGPEDNLSILFPEMSLLH